jgi:hypothetical protein
MTRKQKDCVEWLSWHWELFKDLPAYEHEIRTECQDRCRYIVERLKDKGFIAKRRHWSDVNVALIVYIARIRYENRKARLRKEQLSEKDRRTEL